MHRGICALSTTHCLLPYNQDLHTRFYYIAVVSPSSGVLLRECAWDSRLQIVYSPLTSSSYRSCPLPGYFFWRPPQQAGEEFNLWGPLLDGRHEVHT